MMPSLSFVTSDNGILETNVCDSVKSGCRLEGAVQNDCAKSMIAANGRRILSTLPDVGSFSVPANYDRCSLSASDRD